jgi:hypothetical protein
MGEAVVYSTILRDKGGKEIKIIEEAYIFTLSFTKHFKF